jgi:polar amino acid transport system substrate-binding protein
MISRRVDSRRNCRWELPRLAWFVGFFMFAPMSLTIAAPAPQEFRWAADPEGGAPFVEADPAHPDRVVGFDVEIAEIIAQRLNRSATFLNVGFTSIDQSIDRGDAEIGLGGIEDTPGRRATMAPTVPYYRFREVLSVRDADASRFRTLADLRGRRVGTLGGTISYEILLRAERDFGIKVVSYDDDVHPYTDLVIERVDAVLLDNVLADRRRGFTIQPGKRCDRPLRRGPGGPERCIARIGQ